MEPVSVAVICAVVFGVVTALSAFIHQLLLSRDKNLNDAAQRRAILQETKQLEKLRTQMESNQRFDSHYQVLGANKDSIQYIDQKIEGILNKKLALIQHYAQMTVKESSLIIDAGQSTERKAGCDLLKNEIDNELKFYEGELHQLQTRRASIWDARDDLQDYLIAHEQSRNEVLDKLYQGHTGLLEKIYTRHGKSTDRFATHTVDLGSQSYKDMILAPIKFLAEYFKLSSSVSPGKAEEEKKSRKDVRNTENEINGDGIGNKKAAFESDSFVIDSPPPLVSP